MTTQELTITQQPGMTLAEMRSYGEILAQSGFFEGRNAAQCAVLVMAGQEIGVPPFAAMNGIYMIKGRPFVGAHILAAKVKASGRYDYRVKRLDETECTLVFLRAATGEVIGESTYTFQMAVKAGIAGKDTYRQHASDMLYARAMTRGAKRYCPDVINGLDIAVDEAQTEPERAVLPPMTQEQRVNLLRGPEGGDVIDAVPGVPAEPMPETMEEAIDRLQGEAPMQPAQQPAANGKAKPARVSVPGKDWNATAEALAARVPYFAIKETGKPDYYHLVGAAGNLGFQSITVDNLADVIVALEQYASEKADAQAARA